MPKDKKPLMVIDMPPDVERKREGIVGRLAGRLARTATGILASVPDRAGSLIEEGIERLEGGIGRTVGSLLGGAQAPSGKPPTTGAAPAAPPPPAPVPSGCSSGSVLLSGGSGACGGAAEKLFHQFAVLSPFSVVLPGTDEDEITWLSREPLLPSSAPRPPNARPG